MGKGDPGVEVGLGGGAVANPARCHLGVALDGGRHGPAYGLNDLRGQVARDREKTLLLAGVHHRQLPAFERVVLVGVQLADHLHHIAVVTREQQALLAVGGETHVAINQSHSVGTGDGFLTQALHVKRHLLLPLCQLHAHVKRPRPEHGTQTLFQQGRIHFGRPGANGVAVLVEDTDQRKCQVAGLRGLHVDRGAAHGTSFRQGEVGKIGVMARSPSGLRHMQTQRLVRWHRHSLLAGLCPAAGFNKNWAFGG